MPNDDIRNLWQAHGSADAPLTLEELRKKGESSALPSRGGIGGNMWPSR